MNDHLSAQIQSIIVGSSVHHQRVEKFNKDRTVNITYVFS